MVLLLVHAAATCAMAGLIWFVQVVHYPLFARVGADGFARYEAEHATRTTLVVAPLMLVEAACAFGILFARPSTVPAAAAWAGVGLVVAIWASTFWLQVPQHTLLSAGFQPQAHGWLVTTNWIRTAGWTLRAALALWLVSLATPR